MPGQNNNYVSYDGQDYVISYQDVNPATIFYAETKANNNDRAWWYT